MCRAKYGPRTTAEPRRTRPRPPEHHPQAPTTCKTPRMHPIPLPSLARKPGTLHIPPKSLQDRPKTAPGHSRNPARPPSPKITSIPPRTPKIPTMTPQYPPADAARTRNHGRTPRHPKPRARQLSTSQEYLYYDDCTPNCKPCASWSLPLSMQDVARCQGWGSAEGRSPLNNMLCDFPLASLGFLRSSVLYFLISSKALDSFVR